MRERGPPRCTSYRIAEGARSRRLYAGTAGSYTLVLNAERVSVYRRFEIGIRLVGRFSKPKGKELRGSDYQKWLATTLGRSGVLPISFV